MAGRGPDWADWVRRLPAIAVDMLARWRLRPDGPPMHGHCSLVLPVRTADGSRALARVPADDLDTLAALTDPDAFAIGRTGALHTGADGTLDWRL